MLVQTSCQANPVPLSSIASVLPRDTSLAVKQLELVDKLSYPETCPGLDQY